MSHDVYVPSGRCGYQRHNVRCRRVADRHVLLSVEAAGETKTSMVANLCSVHVGRAFQDGAIAAHPLAWDCIMPGTAWSDNHSGCHVDGTGVNPYDSGEVSSDA